MEPLLRLRNIPVKEYLEREAHSPIRHEYIDGEMYAMNGSALGNNQIVSNLVMAFARSPRRSHGCTVLAADMKVRVESTNAFYYPDLVTVCQPGSPGDLYITAPCMIVEVLSPSTARVDRREKLLAYQTLASLEQYLMIDPRQRLIDVWRRERKAWTHALATGHDRLALACWDLTLSLDEIYDRVDASLELEESGPVYVQPA